MKKILFSLLILTAFSATAQEGMWLPALLQQNEEQMHKQGFTLTADDVYAVNHTSMKDAVVLFGGGCTGEVISDEGLVLTNHHCGFSAVLAASTVEHNYLKDGFWSYNRSEEIPSPGLSVTFIISMEDVTDKIIPSLTSDLTEQQRTDKVREISAELVKNAIAGTHYGAYVRSMYYGNQYYLFITETYKDIRLVGVPPESVGNFGGETDNWIWPRHTADFSIFRIYANKNNEPAEYSADNVPYKPRYYFPVSLKGVQENDFTLVYGFPGKTQEYLPASAVDMLIHTTDPNRIACRDARIAVMHEFMDHNDTLTLMYAGKEKSLANAYKKWKGETIGLLAYDAVEKKRAYEAQFTKWTNTNTEGAAYKNVLTELNTTYAELQPYSAVQDYTAEAFFGVEIINYAAGFNKLMNMIKADTIADSLLLKEAAAMKKNAEGYFKNYSAALDKKMFATLLKIYADNVKKELQPAYFKEQQAKYNNNFSAWANAVFSSSVFADKKKMEITLQHISSKKYRSKLLQDPTYKLYDAVNTSYLSVVETKINPAQEHIAVLMRQYMQAQMLMQPARHFYPDANLTLRVTYGNIKGYYPADGKYYDHATTDRGLEQKYTAGDEEFGLPPSLLKLFKENDFGRYADTNGDLPVGFIATNHTTGGNSGSPVLNAKGELIGINFDRVWEGTMSDIMYDADRCRNISVDIRYILFILDKYAHADNLLRELKIAN